MDTSVNIEPQNVQLLSPEQAYSLRAVVKSSEPEVVLLTDRPEKKELIREDFLLLRKRKARVEVVSSEQLNELLLKYYKRAPSQSQHFDSELQRFLYQSVHQSFSDLHFEAGASFARLRVRSDGALQEIARYTSEEHQKLINQIKIGARLNIAEKRLPQDGRLLMTIDHREREFRVSTIPTFYGEKAVLRVLGASHEALEIESLGLEVQDKERVRETLKRKQGLVLVSGPTGSGKTTSLYSFLKFIHTGSEHIITVEDPIEYTLEGISQVQVRDDIGLGFSVALRSILRQDPDVVMIGEIRDVATAQIAVRAALTGHLVLSTIHTNSALATLSRLRDMGIPEYLIADTLVLSIAQRLIRKLCSHCKVKEDEVKEWLQSYGIEGPIYKAVGCKECYYTGYAGRRALYEIQPLDATRVREVFTAGIPNWQSEGIAKKALGLLSQGEASLEDVSGYLTGL